MDQNSDPIKPTEKDFNHAQCSPAPAPWPLPRRRNALEEDICIAYIYPQNTVKE